MPRPPTTPLMRRRSHPLLALLTAGALAACSDASTTSPHPAPAALSSVTVDSVGIGARLRIGIAGTEPTLVRVRYQPADGSDDPLAIVRMLSPADSTITLTRLSHGRAYTFSASAVSAAGDDGPATIGQFSTPALPPDVAALSFSESGRPTDDLLMLEVRAASGFTGFVAVDREGTVVWYYRTVGAPQGGAQRANGNFVINDLGNGLREISPNGDVLHELAFDFFGPTPHHDVVATPSNTVLFISQDFRTPAGSPTIWGDAIYEWTPETGELHKRWTAWDFLDPAVDWGGRSAPLDWLHANSLAIGPHGNILLSLNWLDQVVSIAPDWSRLEWRLGGKKSDFALDSAAVFSGQHSATMPDEGHVLMFDNGRERTGGAQYSRGLELQLDTVAHRAHVAWEFEPPSGEYAPYLGLARRLANGNTVVFFGLPNGPFGDKVATGPISAWEVARDGTVAWHLEVDNAKSVYRGWPLTTLGGEARVP